MSKLADEIEGRLRRLPPDHVGKILTIPDLECIIAALRAAEQPARYACKMSGGCAHSIKCHSQGRCEYESTPAPAQQPSRDAVLEDLAKSYGLSASLNSISLLAEAQRNFAAQLRALKEAKDE